MASLRHPHWEAVPATLREMLLFIGKQHFSKRYYLAGGTALALRIGHRRSNDLDFFSETDELQDASREEIVAALAARQVQVVEDVGGNLLLLVSGIRVGFFSYGYSMVAQTDTLEGVEIAGLEDIGLMKLDALISRGSKKDFYDVFFLVKEIPLDDLLILGQNKYPYTRDFPLMAVEGMVQFENAERDVSPEMLVRVPWEDVKCFFLQEARNLGNKWFSDGEI